MRRIFYKGIGWTLKDNGDCFSDYNVFYNVLTGESNLFVVPRSIERRLKKEFKSI